jgi:hypothetical protein
MTVKLEEIILAKENSRRQNVVIWVDPHPTNNLDNQSHVNS